MRVALLLFALIFTSIATEKAVATECRPQRRLVLLNTSEKYVEWTDWGSADPRRQTAAELAPDHRAPFDELRQWLVDNAPTTDITELTARQYIMFDGMTRHFDVFNRYASDLVHPVTCFEAYVIAQLQQRAPVQESFAIRAIPDEGEAYLLQKSRRFVTILGVKRSNNGGAAGNDEEVKALFEDQTDALLGSGFRFDTHLHTHPFYLTNPNEDIAGTIMPSGCSQYGDVGSYKNFKSKYGLRQAWISNAFNTGRMRLNSSVFYEYANASDVDFHCGPLPFR